MNMALLTVSRKNTKSARRLAERSSLMGLVLLCATATVARSQTDDTGFSLKYALGLSSAALEQCAAKGYAASVSVVDAKGVVRVVLRDDGAPKAPAAAPLKAATAAIFGLAGSEMAAREQSDASFAAAISAHHDLYNDHPGSLPLKRAGKVIGGVAVADVPHDVADSCVRQALALWPVE